MLSGGREELYGASRSRFYGRELLNVRVPFEPVLNCSQFRPSIAETLTFSQRHNLYQRVRECIQNKPGLNTIQP